MTFDFPAVILLIIFALGGWVLWKTQANPDNDFDFSDMLRDEFGKPSAFRLGIFICLGVSTWAVMYMLVTNTGKIDTWAFIAYMAVWSGAKIADKLVDAYSGRLPDSKSSQVVTRPPAPMPGPGPKTPCVDNAGDLDDGKLIPKPKT